MATIDEVLSNLSPNTAEEVINAGLRFDAYDGDLPDDEMQKITDAAELIKTAMAAFESGIRSPAVIGDEIDGQVVHGILDVAGVDYTGNGDQEATAQDKESTEVKKPPIPAGETPASIDEIIPNYDDLKVKDVISELSNLPILELVDLVKAYEEDNEGRKRILTFAWSPPEPEPAAEPTRGADYGDTQELENAYFGGSIGHERANAERLPAPAEPPIGTAPQIPIDLSSISEGEFGKLFTQFHSLDARALYVQGIEEGRAEAADALGEIAYGQVFEKVYEHESVQLESRSASALEGVRATARHKSQNDHSVIGWKNRAIRHRIEAKNIRQLQRGYEKSVERLSREQTRRQASYERGS